MLPPWQAKLRQPSRQVEESEISSKLALTPSERANRDGSTFVDDLIGADAS
jgi:hypothetical protein